MFQESYMRKIGAAFGLVAIVALAAYTYSTIKSARYMYSGPVTISVTGVGEVNAIPDIATFTFTVSAKEADASTAQSKAKETMGKILTFLKEKGVEDKDVKVQYYDLSPQYEYPEVICTPWSCPPSGEPKIVGYQLNQSMSVKVRNADDAGSIIGGVGEFGAQNVSGLSFTIDDEKKLKLEARDKAIEDAQAQAEKLAAKLGVRVVRMNGYWEESDYGYPRPIEGYGGYGYAGDMAKEGSAVAMEVPPGEQTITSRVNVSYEVE